MHFKVKKQVLEKLTDIKKIINFSSHYRFKITPTTTRDWISYLAHPYYSKNSKFLNSVSLFFSILLSKRGNFTEKKIMGGQECFHRNDPALWRFGVGLSQRPLNLKKAWTRYFDVIINREKKTTVQIFCDSKNPFSHQKKYLK